MNKADRFPGMFEKEARGLDLLRKHSLMKIPQVIKLGNAREEQYLLLEWMESGVARQDCWEKFGAALAMMHMETKPHCGLEEDNYIGSLAQLNTSHSSWSVFFAECRIMPLSRLLLQSGAWSKQDILAAESFCRKAELYFPDEPAGLLHGDLWSGNFMITSSGCATLYDPAVYFGHREMDIGMTRLFGGFPQKFYDAYQEVYPLENGWLQRLPITQLYPILVHAVLFGGHYISQAREIVIRFGKR